MLERLAAYRSQVLIWIALLGLVAGSALYFTGSPEAAELAWAAGTLPVLAGLLVEIAGSLRRGDVGLDLVAALSMTAAVVFGETLAGNVVALMYAGGQLLESFAEGRARREMTALLGRVSRTAMRYRGEGLEEVLIEDIIPGDRLLIRHGEVLPVDGHVGSGDALLDLSALTGESVPEALGAGAEVLSGSTSAGPPFDLVASRPAAESTYAGIVRLVEAAQRSKAPMVRLADRYAVWFLLLTVTVAGAAWLFSGDHIRALAVLVVATPCPLILAVPVAIISGMSRTAKIGVLVKHGGVLESLARVHTAILDKTGTLTRGEAAVVAVRTTGDWTEDEVLRLAASLDQASGHVVAAALIGAATARGLGLSAPTGVMEAPGSGIEGLVEGRRVAVGGGGYVSDRSSGLDPRELQDGLGPEAMTVAVAVDGAVAGVIVVEDRVREDAPAMLAELRAAGAERLVLASGDRGDIARAIGGRLGADLVLGDLSPEDKVTAVAAEARNGVVMMVGDGVNDAPALAAAGVGVAMGARGAAASSEAAGVVLLVDALQPLAQAMRIARRTRGIALQSVIIGLGLSMLGMLAAALGYLPPVQGALLQEAIDVAVILNALRALR